jgi:hypothetical protein
VVCKLNRSFILIIAVPILYVLGCGGGPKLVTVKGKVLFDNGQPVTAASICFIPDADKGNNGQLATSLLAEDGSFTLRTYPHGDGAMLGPYKVTISLGRGTSRKLAKYTRQNDTPFHIDVPPEGLVDLVLTLR